MRFGILIYEMRQKTLKQVLTFASNRLELRGPSDLHSDLATLSLVYQHYIKNASLIMRNT